MGEAGFEAWGRYRLISSNLCSFFPPDERSYNGRRSFRTPVKIRDIGGAGFGPVPVSNLFSRFPIEFGFIRFRFRLARANDPVFVMRRRIDCI